MVADEDLILPPDVSPERLRAAFLEIAEVVGSDHVQLVTRDNMMADSDGHYFNLPREHDLFYVLEKETFLASGVAVPGSTEDTAAIVKIANKYLVPLWPISRGRNLGMIKQPREIITYIAQQLIVNTGYGGAAPRVRGCIVLDMGGRMNKVLEIDEKNATALLEPGVSYFDLFNHLRDNGFNSLWVDVPDLGMWNMLSNFTQAPKTSC